MIGVIADQALEPIVREFFELFKTPWEFYQENAEYDVLLCTGSANIPLTKPRLILHYTAGVSSKLSPNEYVVADTTTGRVVSYKEQRLPLYGQSSAFHADDIYQIRDEVSHLSLSHSVKCELREIIIIGYNLFDEINFLLNEGQPEIFVASPTLDLHISLLREMIVTHGVELIEVPPSPVDHPFIACLTHDVDHPLLRRHLWDRTALGFYYRASWGSLRRLSGSRMTVRDLWRNWCALASLPLIWLSIRKDLWSRFIDAYTAIEKGLPSTYFIIPFKGRPGRTRHGSAPSYRAAGYRATDLAQKIMAIQLAGSEVGLHGIDAWMDAEAGRDEFQEIQRITGTTSAGVRMHWLYFDQQSPTALEAAGAAYDSTVGYNGAVGYRSGTTQVHLLLSSQQLMELPLHIMDTALFYPDHMGLSHDEANVHITHIVDHAYKFGGCVTINWHDRSLLPERQWGRSYRTLIQQLHDRGAWFATASQAVAWFRKRRTVTFARLSLTNDYAISGMDSASNLPDLRIRLWNHPLSRSRNKTGNSGYLDMPLPAYQRESRATITNHG